MVCDNSGFRLVAHGNIPQNDQSPCQLFFLSIQGGHAKVKIAGRVGTPANFGLPFVFIFVQAFRQTGPEFQNH